MLQKTHVGRVFNRNGHCRDPLMIMSQADEL